MGINKGRHQSPVLHLDDMHAMILLRQGISGEGNPPSVLHQIMVYIILFIDRQDIPVKTLHRMPPHFHEKRRRKAFSLRHCCHYSNLFGEEFNRFSCSSLFHQVHTVAFM